MQIKMITADARNSQSTVRSVRPISRYDAIIVPSASRCRIIRTAGNFFFTFKLLSDRSCLHDNRKYHRAALCFLVNIV